MSRHLRRKIHQPERRIQVSRCKWSHRLRKEVKEDNKKEAYNGYWKITLITKINDSSRTQHFVCKERGHSCKKNLH